MLTDYIHSKTLFSNAFLSPNVLQYFNTFMISVMDLVLKELYHENSSKFKQWKLLPN